MEVIQNPDEIRMGAIMSKEQILQYAENCGKEEASNLLILIGPDGFSGSYEEYKELEKRFSTEKGD